MNDYLASYQRVLASMSEDLRHDINATQALATPECKDAVYDFTIVMAHLLRDRPGALVDNGRTRESVQQLMTAIVGAASSGGDTSEFRGAMRKMRRYVQNPKRYPLRRAA